jgi:uncharacterized protein (TIRG00374 family)
LVVTATLLTLLFRRLDVDTLRLQLGRITPGFFAASLALFTVGQLAYAFRWHAILRSMGIVMRFSEVARLYLIGLFLNNLLPTSVGGDAAKVYYVGRRFGYPAAGASVLIDRFLGLLWLAVIGSVLGWLLPAETPVLAALRTVLTAGAVLLAGGLCVVVAWPMERVLERAVLFGRRAPASLMQGVSTIRLACRQPSLLLVAGAIVGGYAALLALIYSTYFSAAGSSVAFSSLVYVLIGIAILVNVPVSLNGIGLREQLHSVLFAAVAVPAELSVSVAILMFAHTLLLSLVGAALWVSEGPASAILSSGISSQNR